MNDFFTAQSDSQRIDPSVTKKVMPIMRVVASTALADQSLNAPLPSEAPDAVEIGGYGETTARIADNDSFLFGRDAGRDVVWDGIPSTDRIALLGLGCCVFFPFEAALPRPDADLPMDFGPATGVAYVPDARAIESDALFVW